MTLGDKLKQLRTLTNITLKEMSDDLNISITTISFWENDKVIPSQKNINKIADYFSIKVVDLTKLIERR